MQSRLLYKMITIYSLLTVIPLGIVSGTAYVRSKHIIESKIRETSNQALVETADKIDGVLRVFAQLTSDITLVLRFYLFFAMTKIRSRSS